MWFGFPRLGRRRGPADSTFAASGSGRVDARLGWLHMRLGGTTDRMEESTRLTTTEEGDEVGRRSWMLAVIRRGGGLDEEEGASGWALFITAAIVGKTLFLGHAPAK